MFVDSQPRCTKTDSIRCYIIHQSGQQSTAKPPRPLPQGLLQSKPSISDQFLAPMESIGSLIVWPVFEGPSHRQT